LSYNFLDVAFSPNNDHWCTRHKSFLTAVLGPKRIQLFSHAREFEISHTIKSLSQASSFPVNLEEKVFALVDGIVCMVAFGRNYQGNHFRGQKFKEVIFEIMKMMDNFYAENFFPHLGWVVDILTGVRKRLKQCFHNLGDFFERVLEEEHLDPARLKSDREEDLVDSLIALLNDQATDSLCPSKEHIKAILLNVFIGGMDTPVVAIVWAMSELVKNPLVMQKLQAEIRNCFLRKAALDVDDLTKLTYLKMVVKETLRMYPPVPLLIPHEAIHRCKIGGSNSYDVLPKARVLINAWAMGRHSSIWTNPHEFYPEGFEGNNIDFRGQHFELLPFGAGRIICPASGLASSTMGLALANLLNHFDWELPGGMKREDIDMEEGGVTMHGKTALYLVPIKY
ncbi:hypothetical protein NMG60_11007367, partial [Bertholletia excelsa]